MNLATPSSFHCSRLAKSAVLLATALAGGLNASAAVLDERTSLTADNTLLLGIADASTQMANLMFMTGKTAEGLKGVRDLEAQLGKELTARHADLADLSISEFNPWLTPEARASAQNEKTALLQNLGDLANRQAQFASGLADWLGKGGVTVTPVLTAYSKEYDTLVSLENATAMWALNNREPWARHAELVAPITQASIKSDEAAFAAALEKIKALGASGEEVTKLGQVLLRDDFLPRILQITRDHYAIDHALTRYLNMGPQRGDTWLVRARFRFEGGRRAEAIADFNVAKALGATPAALAALERDIVGAPGFLVSIWQEPFNTAYAMEVANARIASSKAGTAPTALSPELERTARAAFRNRIRRLYVCSFISDAAERKQALAWVTARHGSEGAILPDLPASVANDYNKEFAAAGNDVAKQLAVHHRFAPLLGGTEGFWQRHVELLANAGQGPAALAALDVTQTLFPASTWAPGHRAMIEKALAGK